MAAIDGLDFDLAAFTAGIHTAMAVGTDPNAPAAPTFYFPATTANAAPADEEAVPFNPASAPTITREPGVQVPCAITYRAGRGDDSNAGTVTRSTVEITLLGQAHEAIAGFEYVEIDAERFYYELTEAPVGMVTAAVWTVLARSRDDT